jgi:hypothetical protein
MLKPVPLTVACEIVTLAFPVLVSVIACELFVPTATFPKATLLGLAVKVELAATPVPANTSACGEPAALSVNATLPGALPAAVGANCTVNEALCPATSVMGVVIPLTLKPVPETCARLIVRFAFPVFVSLAVCVPLCPTVTFPKLSNVGEIVNWAAVPVPVNGIVSGEFEALLATTKLPATAPADCGANWISMVLL